MTAGGQPVVAVISGPGGVGKGTVVRTLAAQRPDLWVSVSATTRDPRPGETDGVHYCFLDDAAFQRLIDDDGFLEWADFYQRRYGTPAAPVAAALAAGRDVVLEIEVQGARQVRTSMPEAVHVFIAPPSLDDLAERLAGRGDAATVITDRLAIAQSEIDASVEFDHVVVNDDVETAAAAIGRILDQARVRAPSDPRS